MSTVELLAGSLEYVTWPVTATDAAGAAVDPTGDTVEVAIRAVRDTADWAYHTAAWDADADTPTIRVLIGQSPFDLAAGVYAVRGRITDNPEVPVLDLGMLYVA